MVPSQLVSDGAASLRAGKDAPQLSSSNDRLRRCAGDDDRPTSRDEYGIATNGLTSRDECVLVLPVAALCP